MISEKNVFATKSDLLSLIENFMKEYDVSEYEDE